MNIQINASTRLELTAVHHSQLLFEAVDANREHLGRFLPWVGAMQSVSNLVDYTSYCEQLYSDGKAVSFMIFSGEKLVGRIGLHQVDSEHKLVSIGYWLTKEAEGKGIVTSACQVMLRYGFDTLGLNRIELRTTVDNNRSQSIAHRLGFTREGILRQAEWLNNQPQDLEVYSLLRQEWKESQQ